MTISDQQLLEWHQQGIIPGPEEDEEAFIARAHYCEQLKQNFPAMIPGEMHAITDYPEALAMSKRFFDSTPTWMPLYFSNYQLHFWQGGCAWIFQADENSPTAAFFQLRQAFRNAKTYLGLYDRDEIIAHELAHVGRMMFEEPRYEELLAYRTDRSAFRRWFGPIVQSSYESMIFMLLVFFMATFDLFAFYTESPALFQMANWFKMIPLVFILFAVYRLYRKHQMFNKAKQHLIEYVKDEQKADAILYRLRDEEIEAFASMDSSSILQYALQNQELRWRLITLAYLTS